MSGFSKTYVGDVGIACTTGWVDLVDTNLLTGREKGKCRYAVD